MSWKSEIRNHHTLKKVKAIGGERNVAFFIRRKWMKLNKRENKIKESVRSRDPIEKL